MEKNIHLCKICGKEIYNQKITCSDDCLRKLRSINVGGSKNPNFGKKPWCKGLTKETDKRLQIISEKNSISCLCRPSPRRGVKLSQEIRDKVSENHADFSGDKNPNFENFWTKEHKDNISGENHWNYGKTMSQEQKDKIRDALMGSKNHRFGKPAPVGSGWGRKYNYLSPFQGVISLKSSYEYRYALYLDRNNIPWLYEPKSFLMKIIINGKEKETTYRPDFLLLIDEVKFIDTKGYMTKESELKINKFRETYSNIKLEILYREDLQKIGIEVK